MLGQRPSFVVAAAAAVCRREQVLVLRRGPRRDAGAGLWEVPAGRIRPGEEPLEAAERELAEETGLRLALETRPVDAMAAWRGARPMVIVLYRVRLDPARPAPAVRLGAEHDAHGWWTLERAAASNMPARLQQALARALALPAP